MNRQILVQLTILIVINNAQGLIPCTEDEKSFKCNQSDLTVFTMGSNDNIKCPPDMFCNYNYQKADASSFCIPCRDKKSVCNKFECVPNKPSKVSIMGMEIDCPNTLICNSNLKTNCSACIREVCDSAMSWKCSSTDPTKFTINNMEGQCKPGYVCKTENTPPCNEQCIKDTAPITTTQIPTTTEVTTKVTDVTTSAKPSSTTTLPSSTSLPTTITSTLSTTDLTSTTTAAPSTSTTTLPSSTPDPTTTTTTLTTTDLSSTTTAAPSTPTTTSEPSTASTTTESNPTTTSTEVSITSSTLSSTEPTTVASSSTTVSSVTTPTTIATTVPPFQIPNCNDGHADINPCRPGPSNKVYYYKCVYYSPVWYDYQIKLCHDIQSDPVCRGKVC